MTATLARFTGMGWRYVCETHAGWYRDNGYEVTDVEPDDLDRHAVPGCLDCQDEQVAA